MMRLLWPTRPKPRRGDRGDLGFSPGTPVRKAQLASVPCESVLPMSEAGTGQLRSMTHKIAPSMSRGLIYGAGRRILRARAVLQRGSRRRPPAASPARGGASVVAAVAGEEAAEPPKRCSEAGAGTTAALSDVTNTATGGPPARRKAGPRIDHGSECCRVLVHGTPPPPPPAPEAKRRPPDLGAEYAPDILRALLAAQASRPKPDYMERQPHITARMRNVLVDWLVDVHRSQCLRHATLYLAVGIVDRYLERRPVSRSRLQLAGITSLWIAAKFEEVTAPDLQALAHVTDGACSREQILGYELRVLAALDFKVCFPTASHFLGHLGRNFTGPHLHLARYLMELSLVEYDLLQFAPSQLAAAALALSDSLLGRPPAEAFHREAVGPEAAGELAACVARVHGLLEKTHVTVLQAVPRKYSGPEFGRIADQRFPAPMQAAKLMLV